MPVMVRGRALGVADNGVFTASNTDPIPGGRLWPEAAATWNAMRAAYIADGGNPDDFMPAGPVSSARPLEAQRYFYANQPPAAAYPGTSNHGWAIAVDVKTRAAAAWIMRHGPRYGWSHDEGARVGEWWHFRYVGASKQLLARLRRDPLAGYTASESRWIREYDQLRRTGRDPGRQRVLRRVMTEQRKRIYRAATSDPTGWTVLRKRRYASLKARTT
jgi:hypothetical protein